MKILMLNANRVGVGTYHRALNFGRELARRGHDVTMMTVSDRHRLGWRSRQDAERFRIVECPNWLDGLLPWQASGPLDIAGRIRELWAGNYEVVYAFEYQPNITLPALLMRRFRKFTLISDWCDWHAGASYHFGGYRLAHTIDRYFEEFIRHRADFVTTINRTLRDRACSIGIPAERVAVVNEGVDPSYIAPLDREQVRRELGLPMDVPIVGTIRDADSSAHVLCKAIAQSRYPELCLLLIGSRPEPVRDYASTLGIEDRLIAPGRVSDADLPRYLAAADVLALPLEDNLINRGRWPHKLGDMLATGTAVITSRAGEFSELLEERDCAVVIEFDAAAFGRAIDAVIEAPHQYVGFGVRGRQLIETELNWTRIGEQLEDMLRRAMSA